MARQTASDKRRGRQRDILDAAWGGPPPTGNGDGAREKRGQYAFARYTVQGDHYAGFYQTWVKAILFLLGRQWLKWMASARRYQVDTNVPPWRQQPVTNICYAIYRSIETKLKKQKPTLEVVPPSGDSDDREAAALGGSVLEELWRKLKIAHRMRRAIGWFICTGQVYLRVAWDPDAGDLVALTKLMEVPHADPEMAAQGETEDREVAVDEQGAPKLRPDGSIDEDAEPAMVPEGEIAVSVVDPLCVRMNPDAEDDEDADEWFIGTLWPKQGALTHFALEELELYSATDGDREMFEDLISAAAAGPGWLSAVGSLGAQVGASNENAVGGRVLVLEFYSRKDRKTYPQGRHWINIGPTQVWPKAGDTTYPTGEAPLPEGFWPPLIAVKATPIPGQPQAMGVLPQVVPLNEQYNGIDGKILEHEVLMTMGGKYAVHPEDKGLVINSDPGQVLASKGYALGKPPLQLRLEPLPEAVYQERQVMMDKVRLVASLSDMDLGKKPEGVSAGRSFLVMQEVVDSVIAPDLEAWEGALEEMGRRELVLAQRHYTEPRQIKIRGERGQWEVRSFEGADLTDGLDVRVQVGSSFPWSKSAQWDTKIEMLSKFPGLFTDPETGKVDQGKFSKFMDVGAVGLSTFESDEDPDLVEIQREHAMFEAYDPGHGEQQLPQIAFWQSHATHLEWHYTFMKRDMARYLRWKPAAQAAFLAHMKQTAQAVNDLAEIAANAAGGGMGAPAPGGAGAPPGGGAPGAGPAGPSRNGLSLVPNNGGGAAGPAAPGASTSKSLQQPHLQPADFAAAGE